MRNKEEPALRDQGLICLGLCCMIDSVRKLVVTVEALKLGEWALTQPVQKMAAQSFGLFVQQLTAADDHLKVKVAQIVFDLLMVQDIQTLVSMTMPVSSGSAPRDTFSVGRLY